MLRTAPPEGTETVGPVTRDQASVTFGSGHSAHLSDLGEPPPQREQKRLLAAVSEIAATLAAEVGAGEYQGRLTERAVAVLRGHDLWRMRLCRELGGLELPIVVQLEVLAALAAQDPSSAWCTMVANSSVAVLGATMPDAAVHHIFADGVPACSIVAAPGGRATAVDDGYLLTGIWRLASGIHHADWVHATAHVGGDPSRLLPLALPAGDLELLDTWDAVGLAGTGSADFALTDYFLPTELTGREANPYGQLRGTRRYDRIGFGDVESFEHLAFALGVGRRALIELQRLLSIGQAGRRTSDREAVQIELGRAEIQLRAIDALAHSVYERVDRVALGQADVWSGADCQLPRALATWATQVALSCTQLAFQRAGAVALQRRNPVERLLRDMSVAATHVLVNDAALASYARQLLEFHDPDA